MKAENNSQLLAKYQKVVADSQMGLWEWDFAENVLYYDKGIKDLVGIPGDRFEIPLEECIKIIHPDDLAPTLEYGSKSVTDDFENEFLLRIITDKNKIKFMRSRAQQVRNSEGVVIGLMGLSWDVSRRVQLEKEEEAKESHFKLMVSLIDSSGDLFGFADKSGVPLYVNKAGLELYGISVGEKLFIDFVSRNDRQYMYDVALPQLRKNKFWEGEVRAFNSRTKEEIPLWLRLFSVQVGPKESDLFYACSGNDLRKMKAIQNSLINQSKMAALGEMAAEMAHEINNPLMIIQIKAQMIHDRLLAGSMDTQKVIADLKLIEKNSHRIQKIVHSSKTISRNAEIDPYASVSILTLIDEAIEVFQDRFKKRNINLDINVEAGISYDDMIEARGSEILQVLVNLINNSYDAIKNQPAGWIHFNLARIDGHYEIQVLDSGEPIPKDIADKMMNPFFTTKPTGQGTGLGLSLTKQIIENHKGHFFYDPIAERTRFTVRLLKKIGK